MSDNRHTVTLPDIGEGVVEGEVIEWLKNPGETLKQDEPVVLIMTDKATVELPAPYPGILSKIYYSAGQIAIKDEPLYDIALNTPLKVTPQEKTKQPTPPPIKKASPSQPSGKALTTPPVRKLAKELGINLEKVKGSGPDGRIIKDDLQQSSSQTPFPRFPDDRIEPITGIPRLMADKMTESYQNIAHFSYFEELDATRLVQLRQNMKQQAKKEGIRLTYMPLFLRALSLTLLQFPKFNSNIDRENEELIIHNQHNIGIAVNTGHGLIVPVLHSVQKMSLEEIIKNYERLKEAAKSHKLTKEEMQGSTISLSNFGVLGGGGKWATPVIHYPEVAILAVARIQKGPLVKKNEFLIRDTLNLSWSFDHRIIDGDMAANFSHYFAKLLENPASLL